MKPAHRSGVFQAARSADVLAACDHEIGRGREHVLEQLDWSLDKYRNELAKALARINPARFAGMVDPRRVLIIEAAADTCMPPSSRERLWQAMERPERVAYLYDHRTAFLAMTFLGGNNLQQQIYRFLERGFFDRPPRSHRIGRPAKYRLRTGRIRERAAATRRRVEWKRRVFRRGTSGRGAARVS